MLGFGLFQWSVGLFVFFSYTEDEAMTEERDPQVMETELRCKDLMCYAKKIMHGFTARWEDFVFGLEDLYHTSLSSFFFLQNWMVLNSYYSQSFNIFKIPFSVDSFILICFLFFFQI